MIRFAFLAFLLLPLTASAGGSLPYEDLAPLLAKRPDLAARLEGIQVSAVGIGTRIGYRACPALDGERVGPYKFAARGEDGRELTVLFQTRDLFRAKNGRVLAVYLSAKPARVLNIAQAVSFDEDLVDVQVLPGSPYPDSN